MPAAWSQIWRCVGLERIEGVHDRAQRLVVDVDEFDCIAR